ncbi:VOC family protein [Sciscionella sediminilitoris]|uniref:VOC family protein n=1 Tax=Sciscionella sediminilitoris TaxID=1445613 RepID=UPI0005606423|nr:VOC family protein [Sciscionella sp. SE31]
MTTPRLDMIGIVTADLEASLAFYRTLGIETPREHEGPHVEATLPGGLRIAWDTEESVCSFVPGWQAPSGHPRTALAFLCATPSEVDSTYTALTAAGYHGETAPWDAPWGQRYATVHDPDGNPVDLFAWA